MRKSKHANFLLIILFFLCLSVLNAQTNDMDLSSTEFDMSGAPQWARDLRRAEIITFGAFPIMYLFASTILDISVENFGQDHRFRSIGIAAGGAVLISLIDYSIVLMKRKREAREILNLPPGTPIIIRKPLIEEEIDNNKPEMEAAALPSDDESP